MAINPEQQTKLIAMLAELAFDRRYYRFYEEQKAAESTQMPGDGRSIQAQLLAETGLAFTYDSKEKFFGHQSEQSGGKSILNVIFRSSTAEFVVYFERQTDLCGGTYHGLARTIALQRDPNFAYQPRYPRLPYATEEQLRTVIRFGVDLFREMQPIFLAAST